MAIVSDDELARLAARHVPGDRVAVAVAVGLAESGGDTAATGDTDKINERTADGRHWGPSVGIWQVRSIIEESGTGGLRDANKLRDPASNAAAMGAISSGGSNFGPWGAYTNGSYRRFLERAHRAAGRVVEGSTFSEAPDRAGEGFTDYSGPYEAASGQCAGKAAPGAQAVMDWLVGSYAGRGVTASSLYRCTFVAGTNTPSVHQEGRALDVGVPTDSDPIGGVIAALLIQLAPWLGVQQILWDHRSWRPERGWRSLSASADPHTDHLHVELRREAAAELTPEVVTAIATSGGGGVSGSFSDVTGLPNPLEAIRDVGSVLAEFFALVTSAKLWLRILSILAGGALVMAGLGIMVSDVSGFDASKLAPMGRLVR